jgi:signal transduction histidine kinase/ligand-binding sensor domain-containing protein
MLRRDLISFRPGWIILRMVSWLVSGAFTLPVAAVPNYLVRTWQSEAGLPQNKVTAVVQTRDGYLWVGTYGGLARFDGVQFNVFDENNTPELRGSRVTSLCEAPEGTLWIGDESGQVTQYRDGTFRAVPLHPAWHDGKISGIAADDAGDIWLMNESGELARVRDGLVLVPEAGTTAKVVNMTRSAQGTIWIARDGRVSVLEQGRLRVLRFETTGTNAAYVQGVGASHDGGLWVAGDGRLRKWKNDQWVQDMGEAPWTMHTLTCLIETRNGTLLAGTSDSGLFLVFPTNLAMTLNLMHTNGFPSDWVISACEDRERNYWIGTGGGGLALLRPNNIQTVSPPDRWQDRAVLSVCPGRDGALWVGTEGAGLYRLQSNAWTNFPYISLSEGIRNPYIWSLAEDPAGRIWVGTWGGGLFVRNDGQFDFAPGMENIKPPMPALWCARDGGLWVGTAIGLLRYQSGNLTWFTENNGQPLRDVRTVAEDSRGAIWFGMAGGGLACLEEGHIRQFRKAEGLSSDFINCLHFDGERALWIGTFGGGLCRYKDGRFTAIRRKQGLPNNVIGHIADDGRGYYWMSSHGGIFRISQAELNACADGKTNGVHCLTYGINDGLPTLECSEGLQPAGCRTADGRLWFPTSKGLVAVDPYMAVNNPLPPPVVVEAVRLDDRMEAEATIARPIKIPPGRHRVEFQYTGLSFAAPEKVRFKYRLTGLDADWVDAGTRRAVNYNYIPPGNYTFQVIACNNDGVWNEQGAKLGVIVLPYFWQTLWFRALGLGLTIVASGGLVWFIVRRRMRRKLERLERQRAVERERMRIARDIHDDLGASLTRINLLSQSARRSMDNAPQTAKSLEHICTTARQLTRTMDEIVWAVDPQHDTLDSLASYLGKLIHEALGDSGIRCRLDFPLHLPAWPLTAEVRHNLFLAFKEALHNILKHSRASEVQVALKLEAAAFTLSVADNGCGFDAAALNAPALADGQSPPRRNGLANMCERLREIGGRCEIRSERDRGARITFSLPVNVAAK